MADADALVIRQRYRAMFPFAAAGRQRRDPGTKSDQAALPRGGKADRTGCQGRTQIMMVLENTPVLTSDAEDVERDAGAALKKPPGECVGIGPINPIGIQPRLHILMAGDRDELLAALPDRL